MLVPSWLWIFILALSGAVQSFKHQLTKPEPHGASPEGTGVARSGREKRSAATFLKGVIAMRTLLSGAKNVRSQSWTFKNYEKKGDFDTARADFYKVVPPDTAIYTKKRRGKKATKMWTGYVGNLTIQLKKLPSGKPTIEIIDEFKTPNAGNQSDIKIIYKN